MMCSTLFYRNLIKDDFKLIRSSSKLGSKLIKTCYLLDKITLFVQLLRSLFDSNCNSNSHFNLGLLPAPIIDAERVYKLACKRVCEDCSTSVGQSTTRCEAHSIKRSAEALRVRSISTSFAYFLKILYRVLMLP